MKTRVNNFFATGTKKKTFKLGGFYVPPIKTLEFSDVAASPSGKKIKRIYCAGERFLVYCDDGKVYERLQNAYTAVTEKEFFSSPEIVEIIFEGVDKLLLFSEDASVIEGDFSLTERNVPFGYAHTVIKGMLFVANGRLLRYSEQFDFSDFNVGLTLGGYFETEKSDGDIVFICELNEKLCVICEHSVITIDVSGDRTDYTARKAETGFLSVVKNSAVKIGGSVFFLSDGTICKYDGSLKRYAIPEGALSYDYGKANRFNGFYLLPFKKKAESKLLCVKSGKEDSAFITEGFGEVFDDGFSVNGQTNRICRLIEMTKESPLRNEQTDMGSCAAKAVTRIEVCSDVDFTLTVTGDFGSKTFTAGKGCNAFDCLLISRCFDFSVNRSSDNVRVVLKYKFLGER